MADTRYGLPEIPSEYIEPYLVKYFVRIIEEVGFKLITPKEAREDLKTIESFVGMFCGVHARLASGNEFHKLTKQSDEEMIKFCEEILKTKK